MSHFPASWAKADLEKCVEILDNKRVPINADERTKRQGEIPYYGATGQAGWIDDFIFNEELVLLGEDGAPFFEKEKNVAFVIKGKSWVNNHAHVLKALEGVTLNTFVLHYLNHFDYTGFVGGTTRLKLTQGSLRKIPFPLPPLPEQKRIVAKLDTLFVHLDQLKARLEKIPTLLKQFRQAVLTQAVTGMLTEQWRMSNANILGATALIPKMLNEREEKYLVDLKEATLKGLKKPTKPRLQNREVDSEDLVEIPPSWVWLYGETLFERIFDGTHFSPKNFQVGKYKYITAKNIKEWGIDLSTITYVSEEDHKEIYSRADVKPNDVLYIKDGATTGIATINNLEEEFSLLSSVGVFRCNMKYILPQFVKYYLNGNRERFLANIAGIAITRLTLDKLNNAIFCLPPFEEQKEIVRRVESLFAMAGRIEASYNTLQEKIVHLPQTILSQAFRGELVSKTKLTHS